MKRTAMPKRSTELPRGGRLRAKSRIRSISGKPGHAHTKKALSKLARRLVVELRDGNTCQRCPNSVELGKKIDWAHVKAGRAESLTWAPWASLALCAGCHFWFDGNGNGKPETVSRRWWAEKFPDRDLLLRQWEQQSKRKKFDPALTRLWLEQEIAKYGAAS